MVVVAVAEVAVARTAVDVHVCFGAADGAVRPHLDMVMEQEYAVHRHANRIAVLIVPALSVRGPRRPVRVDAWVGRQHEVIVVLAGRVRRGPVVGA